jgi:polygalacturonase
MSYDITAYGAVGDGKTLCTAAIQPAIDACHQNGGGRVVVPAGTFKTGTIWLKSHVELHLESGATLLGSENLDDYNSEDAYVQNYRCDEEEWCGKHLIIVHEQQDVSITGFGVIDGNGHLYYCEPEKRWNFLWVDGLALAKDKERLRPGQVIVFVECQHVRVQDIRMQNTTCWNIHFHGCEFVQVRGVTIQNPSTYANTDGIDIDTCRHVTVSDCIIDTADDAFAIRGAGQRLVNPPEACEYVTISNCVLGSSSGAFRFGVGNSPIRHVRISNLTIKRCATAFIFTSNYSAARGMYTPISDVMIQNVSVAQTQRAIKFAAVEQGEIRDILLENVFCRTFAGSYVKAPEGDHIHNVRFENVRLEVADWGQMNDEVLAERRPNVLWIEEADGFTFRHVQILGADKTVMPWESDIMVKNGTPVVENCCLMLKKEGDVR